MDLREEPYDGPIAQRLVAAVQQEYVALYGGPDAAPVHPGEFAPPGGRFYVGYRGTEPVATGGLRMLDRDTVEIKRMFVVPAARRQGLARIMLARLEAAARELGARRVLLETGAKQPEAIQLYETSGYDRVAGFGHYRCAPGSVSFGKEL